MYIDGETNSDRLRLLLCLNSVPIYLNSSYEEFYSYLLKDKINYIKMNSIQELEDKYIMIYNDVKLHKEIIKNNKYFIKNILTTDNIYLYLKNIIFDLYLKT